MSSETVGVKRKVQKVPLFHLGQLVMTLGARDALLDSGDNPTGFLERHAQGDWGELPRQDKEANDRAVMERTRILSAYRTSQGVKLWLITEADRSVTTFLLPEEY